MTTTQTTPRTRVSDTAHVGMRVSYEDMANPRKAGEVVDVVRSAWGVQYAIRWDAHPAPAPLDYSDCRQSGWRIEPADTSREAITGQLMVALATDEQLELAL